MKRVLLVALLLAVAASPVFAQRKTEAEERQRFETVLGYVQTLDPPSRHTAIESMKKFGEWIEPELLGRLSTCSLQERMAFLNVLYDRRCRKALEPATAMLPEAINRLRAGQIAAIEIGKLRAARVKAEKAGDNAEVDRLDGEMAQQRANIPYFDVQRGDEVFIICAFMADFGREDTLKKLVDVAIQSATDDAVAKGEATKFSRTHRDKLLPGGTEMWNSVYSPVWEALRKLATRSLDLKGIAAERKKLETFFDKLEKTPGVGPNQEAALQNYHVVRAAMIKVEKKAKGEEVEPDEGDGENGGGGGGDDVKIIKG
jgi:hypothetical protein